MKVRFEGNGAEIEGGLLWLDARRPKPFCVITHAHADHVARHETVLCTPETAALVRRRTGSASSFVERRYGQKTTVGDCTVTLLSAGHILGSAMALVEGPGGSLLYTGDVRMDGGLTCPPADPSPADLLITESTFGRPDHRLPPAERTRAQMLAFAREALAANETPVFLAYALGKAQEVMTLLCGAGIQVAAHGTVWGPTRVYREFGIRFPGSRKLAGKGSRRAAIVVPPRFLNTPEVQQAAPLRVAAVTGWGDRTLGSGIETSFPLSDHADFDGLIALARQVRPKKVLTLHGYAEELAQELRDRGFCAQAVPGHFGPEEGTRPGMFGQLQD